MKELIEAQLETIGGRAPKIERLYSTVLEPGGRGDARRGCSSWQVRDSRSGHGPVISQERLRRCDTSYPCIFENFIKVFEEYPPDWPEQAKKRRGRSLWHD